MAFSPTDVPAEDLVMDDPNMERANYVLDSTGSSGSFGREWMEPSAGQGGPACIQKASIAQAAEAISGKGHEESSVWVRKG